MLALNSERSMRRRFPVIALIPLFTILSLAGDKKTDPDEIGDRNVAGNVNFYSIEKEMAMGKQLAAEVEKQSKIIDEPILSEYINRLGQNLTRNSDARIPISFKIIDSDSVNAFTLPGGHIFVNSGLIRIAQTEAELAGAMAHEIGHAAARHVTRQQTRAQIANLATIPLIFLGGWTGYALRQGTSLAIPMTFLSFSRAFEGEADLLGLEYMYKAGYDPTATIDIFERIDSLQKTRPSAVAKVFATHPMTEDRIRTAQKNINEILPAKPEYVVNTSEFNDMRARMIAMHREQKREPADPKQLTLKRAPSAQVEGAEPDSDSRPTLQRHEDLL